MTGPDPLAAFRSEYPVTVDIPVAWGDMDAFQHVNNVSYFRYFETARIRCFEEIGYTALMQDAGQGPILAATDCRFRLPLDYPDTVTAGTYIGEIRTDGFMMHYAVFSQQQRKLAAEGTGRIVSFDYREGKKIPLPETIRRGLERLGQGG